MTNPLKSLQHLARKIPIYRYAEIYIILWIILIITCFHYGNQFKNGYESGYNDMQDTLQQVINCNFVYPFFYYDYTEGIYDWWDNPFWYQQGYEEGAKQGARDYLNKERS